MPSKMSANLRPLIWNREKADRAINVGVRSTGNHASTGFSDKQEYRVLGEGNVMVVDQMCAKVVFAKEDNCICRASPIHAAPLKMLAMAVVLVLHPSRPSCESDN
jgi:hypothetical protein